MSTPPNSPNQPAKEVALRGHDYALNAANDEYLRATAYRDSRYKQGAFRLALLLKLRGSDAARRELEHNWLPVSDSAPPYIEAP